MRDTGFEVVYKAGDRTGVFGAIVGDSTGGELARNRPAIFNQASAKRLGRGQAVGQTPIGARSGFPNQSGIVAMRSAALSCSANCR